MTLQVLYHQVHDSVFFSWATACLMLALIQGKEEETGEDLARFVIVSYTLMVRKIIFDTNTL